MTRGLLLALMFGLVADPHQAVAETPAVRAGLPAAPLALDAIVTTLAQSPVVLSDASGRVLGSRNRGDGSPVPLAEPDIVAALQSAHLTAAQAAVLWDFVADRDTLATAPLGLVRALVAASDTPPAREALWSELSGLATATAPDKGPAASARRREREPSLLTVFERNRDLLLPLLGDLRETEPSEGALIELMLTTRVFGADPDESAVFVSARIPAAVARHIERERGFGRQVRWEYAAFASMMRWKDAHLVPGAAKAPTTLAAFDEAGRAFVTVFNCLHALNEGYREVILRGLGPAEIFNAVVAGETELYLLGTSGYRDFLHAIIMRGIDRAGSFEAFLDRANPRQLGEPALHAAGRRGMVFLRILSSFGLLDSVLAKVRDRDRFISTAITALDDQRSYEANSSVVMDLLTARSKSPAAVAFKRALLDRLYDRYRATASARLRNAYGSLLSVYQTVTGDRRDSAIDREFALDGSVFQTPFERLFSGDGDGGFVHRMFMRMDDDADAVETYATFSTLMRSAGATVRNEPHFDVFRFAAPGRTVEIYANTPRTSPGRDGIAGITQALQGRRVETVIGRGHTSIIAPLQVDARRVLGNRIGDVAAVIVGSCGGDASVRELIATFGYIPFVTTKSAGRQVINNAIIVTYVSALMALPPGEPLSVAAVLDRAIARFTRPGVDEALRTDAGLYQVSLTTMLTTRLFDAHVRGHRQSDHADASD